MYDARIYSARFPSSAMNFRAIIRGETKVVKTTRLAAWDERYFSEVFLIVVTFCWRRMRSLRMPVRGGFSAPQTFRIFILKAGASRQSQEIVKLVTASVSSLFYLWNCPTFAENRGYSGRISCCNCNANSRRSLTGDLAWMVYLGKALYHVIVHHIVHCRKIWLQFNISHVPSDSYTFLWYIIWIC